MYEELEEKEYGKLTGHIFRRLLSLLKPHWKWALGFLICIAIVSAIDSYTTFLSKRIIDEGILAGSREAIVQTMLIYGGVILVQAGAVFGFIFLVGVLAERVRYDLRKRMFNHLQQLSLSYFSQTPVGWIMSRLTSDTERLSDLMTWGILDVTWAVISSNIYVYHQRKTRFDRGDYAPNPYSGSFSFSHPHPVSLPPLKKDELKNYRRFQ
jgi:ATP-binding cassette subfamily B protein